MELGQHPVIPDPREAVVERLSQYLIERRTFELHAAKRSREATPRGEAFAASAEVRAELREEYRAFWTRHMANSAQFPGLQYESPPQVDWDRTDILEVVVRSDPCVRQDHRTRKLEPAAGHLRVLARAAGWRVAPGGQKDPERFPAAEVDSRPPLALAGTCARVGGNGVWTQVDTNELGEARPGRPGDGVQV